LYENRTMIPEKKMDGNFSKEEVGERSEKRIRGRV
jgi:hypothetical protein